MAFQYIDGFDVYPDIDVTPQGLQACWNFLNNVSTPKGLTVVAGRFGAQAIQATTPPGGVFSSNTFGQNVTSGVAHAVGFAFSLQTSNPPCTGSRVACDLLNFWNGFGTTCLGGVGLNAGQQLVLYQGGATGGAVVATAAPTIPVGGWHYCEVEITFGGTANLYLDGLQVLSGVSYSTVAGPCTAQSFHLASGTSSGTFFTVQYDDIYSKNVATREGERRVQTLVPNSNSTPLAWTPLSGSNWQMVADLPVDGDTTYNTAATAGNEDLYGHTALTGTPTAISAVQVRSCVRKDDSASRTFSTCLSSGVTAVNGATVAVTGSYQYARDIYANDPNTSALWTASGVNASLIGQRVVS